MARWVYTIAVLLVAALAANNQCDARCVASLCETGGCHHSSQSSNQSSKDGTPGCHYWRSNLAGAEASPDLAKLPVPTLPAMAARLPAYSLLAGTGETHSRLLERGSPPGKFSVLRI